MRKMLWKSFGGDEWDHTAVDPEHRLLLSLVCGKRTKENWCQVVEDVKKRTGGRTDLLITSDDYSAYTCAIEQSYSYEIEPSEDCDLGDSSKSEKKNARGFVLCYSEQKAGERSCGQSGENDCIWHSEIVGEIACTL
ncbi:MAG: hypothetical protein AB1422_16920, partial [bacterium]